jgi:hypothetical protein
VRLIGGIRKASGMTAAPLVRTAVVLVLPVALFGCGSAPGDADADVAVPSSDAAGDVLQVRSAGSVAARPPDAGLTLPLDAFALTAAEDQVLARAAEARVRECAAGFGLDTSAADPLPFGTAADADAAVATRHDRRYAVADPEVAAMYGYHPPATADVRREFYEAHTSAELEVLVGVTAAGAPTSRAGVPDGGCLGEAARAVGDEAADEAGLRAGEELVSEVQAGAWHAAMADPRVADAFAAWSACLSDAGFDYAAPMQANDDPRWWASEVAGAEEIATAVADVACKESTGLIPVWSAVEAEHQEAWIAEHRAGLDAYRALLDAQVASASTAR